MSPTDEHDPSNTAHALYCASCYNKMPGIGIHPHVEPRKDEIVEWDFTGSISGFDFPIDSPHTKYTRNELSESYPRPRAIADPEAYKAGYSAIDFCAENRGQEFDPSILASTLEFGAGMPHQNNRAEYLEFHGREDEAFEKGE